jgi:hypothetical protein
MCNGNVGFLCSSEKPCYNLAVIFHEAAIFPCTVFLWYINLVNLCVRCQIGDSQSDVAEYLILLTIYAVLIGKFASKQPKKNASS